VATLAAEDDKACRRLKPLRQSISTEPRPIVHVVRGINLGLLSSLSLNFRSQRR